MLASVSRRSTVPGSLRARGRGRVPRLVPHLCAGHFAECGRPGDAATMMKGEFGAHGQRQVWDCSAERVHILSACNEYRQETVILERSAQQNGYTFRAVGLGEAWTGLAQKLQMYDQALTDLIGNTIAPSDHVLLLDAWDTVVLGPATELSEKLAASGVLQLEGGVLVAADRLCCPEHKLSPKMERLFPNLETPWRYPNSGGFAGTAEAVRGLIQSLVRSAVGGVFDAKGDDQLRLQTFLLARAEAGNRYPVRLDTNCAVFQCMGEQHQGWRFETFSGEGGTASPRIQNVTTLERPLVAHGCGGHGRWFLADIYRELHLLDHFGISKHDLEGLRYAGLVPPGSRVGPEHWVNQCPWDFPFQLFEMMRRAAWDELNKQEERRH